MVDSLQSYGTPLASAKVPVLSRDDVERLICKQGTRAQDKKMLRAGRNEGKWSWYSDVTANKRCVFVEDCTVAETADLKRAAEDGSVTLFMHRDDREKVAMLAFHSH